MTKPRKWRGAKKVKLWQAVEVFADGSEFVRHTGAYGVCLHIVAELRACGFHGEVRPATENTDKGGAS